MKTRDICLVASGAIAAIAVIVFVPVLMSTPKAYASAAAAPGANSVVVTAAPVAAGGGAAVIGVQSTIGLITINDSANRRITVVGYVYNAANSLVAAAPGPLPLPTINLVLSTNQSFTY
jgi:hypothetical protein